MRLEGETRRSMKRGGSLFELCAGCPKRITVYILKGRIVIDLCYGQSAVLGSGFRAIEFGVEEVTRVDVGSYSGRIVGLSWSSCSSCNGTVLVNPSG